MQRTTRMAGRWSCLAVVAVVCGCKTCAPTPVIKTTKCICAPHGPCAGYFSTCWRQWPSECVACPPVMEADEAPSPSGPPPLGRPETVPPPAATLEDMPYDPPAAPAAPADEPPDDPTSFRIRPGRNAASMASPNANPVAKPAESTDPGSPRGQLKIVGARPDDSVVGARPDDSVVVRRTAMPPAQPPASGIDSDQPMLLSYPSGK